VTRLLGKKIDQNDLSKNVHKRILASFFFNNSGNIQIETLPLFENLLSLNEFETNCLTFILFD
jgi:hypothetical protein